MAKERKEKKVPSKYLFAFIAAFKLRVFISLVKCSPCAPASMQHFSELHGVCVWRTVFGIAALCKSGAHCTSLRICCCCCCCCTVHTVLTFVAHVHGLWAATSAHSLTYNLYLKGMCCGVHEACTGRFGKQRAETINTANSTEVIKSAMR